MTFQTLYDVACPYCRADVGMFCRVAIGPRRGRGLPYPHEARRLAYRIANKPVRSAP